MTTFIILRDKIIRKIRKFYRENVGDRTHLLIIDDFFPNPLSVFRYVEFDIYLKSFNTLAYTTGHSMKLIGESRNILHFIKEYKNKHVKKFDSSRICCAKLAYIVFLNNADMFLTYLEKNKIPFIFTLYPGGGFVLNNDEVDMKLKRIFNSPFFRKVIVTQNVTENYLIKKSLCKKTNIEYIYGSPFGFELSTSENSKKIQIKNTFDICFVAAKYTKTGMDKGYDIFIDVVRKLILLSDKFRFHVAGGFDGNEMEISDICDVIKFYGYLSIEKLREFYENQDIIISPNRANILSNGAFDGFPTASVVEAGLKGVAMLVTDELFQNAILTNNKDYILINHDSDFIVSKVMELFKDNNKLIEISNEGKKTLQNVFSNEYQMTPRLNLISNFMNK